MPPFNMDETYGSLLIGAFFAIFLQGMLTVQAYIYYESFPTDSKRLKWLVAVVWVLDLAHLIFICRAVYHYLINSWGNDAALLQSTEDFDILVVLVGAVIVLCQGFFLRRIRKFSGNNWLAGLLGLACLAILGLDTMIAVKLSINKSITSFSSLKEATIILSSAGAGVDILMAGILVWYLRKEGQTLERTNFALTRIIQYTVATGLATSIWALALVAACVLKPDSFIFIGMHFSLGRMYTNALLATLNSRRDLRGMLKTEIRLSNLSWAVSHPSGHVSSPSVAQATPTTHFSLGEIGDKRHGSLKPAETDPWTV